jgi:hypothetical protein
METYTEEAIRQKLANDERCVRRALIRLYERQTADLSLRPQNCVCELRTTDGATSLLVEAKLLKTKGIYFSQNA